MPYISRLFLASLFFVVTIIVQAYAQTQSNGPCDGRFERFLKGYAIDIDRGEMDPFLHDNDAIEACRKQLDFANLDHALIETFIQSKRWISDDSEVNAKFQAICARGRKLGCVYAIASISYTRVNFDTGRLRDIAQLKSLLGTGLPIVKYRAGLLMTSGPEPKAGIALLESASKQGDYTATMFILNETITDLDDPKTEAIFLAGLRKAASQGHTAAMVKLADHSIEVYSDYKGALALYRRASNADPRYFQNSVAEARYKLGLMLRDGIATVPNALEANYWFDRALELGYQGAHKLPLPSKP